MDFNSEKFDNAVFVQNEAKDTQEDKSGPPEKVETPPKKPQNQKGGGQKKSPLPAGIDYGHLKAKVQAIVTNSPEKSSNPKYRNPQVRY